MNTNTFPLLLLFFLLFSSLAFSQNSTEAPGSIGPASSLNIDTSPIGASTNIEEEKKFLTKYEFYTAMLNLLPIGWQLSERESNIIISRENVTVQKEPMDNTPEDPIAAEEQATIKYGKKTYELMLRFESYPKSQYLSSKDRFGTVNETLEKLEEKYAVAEMKLDDGTGWYIAKDKDQKNRLVGFHIEKATLEEQLSPVPELYVENYAIHIEKDAYYKLYPVRVETQLNMIIQQVQKLLK